MQIDKAKLPKGKSYVLRSSTLASALESAGIELEAMLFYSPGFGPLSCEFWPIKTGMNDERLYITSGAVPGAAASSARDFIEQVGVPEFVAWVKSILTLPRNSPRRRAKQHFALELPAGTPNNSSKPTPLRGAA